MRAKSSAKVKQAMDLMKVLQLRQECRERIDKDGFIEKMIFWIDDEQYPAPAGPIPQSVIDKEEAAATPTDLTQFVQ